MDFLKVKNNFNFDFYTRRSVYDCYQNIYNRTNGEDYLNSTLEISDHSQKDIIIVNNIPGYFEARIEDDNPAYKLFRIHYLDGFLIDLKDFTNLEDFMKFQFGSKSRSRLRGFMKRLETCFDIQYKMYHGKITKEKFHFLMDTLRVMISKRFVQRGDIHESLKNWDYYKNSAYDMILQKKASLFVIYDHDKPIDICLNYHHQNILFGNIKSYDIDYAKFRMGSIDTLKLLEWCLENGYTILDLSHGNLDYKHKWCNSKYIFEHHVLYNHKKISKKLMAYIMFRVLELKAFLKSRKVDVQYHKIRAMLKGNRGQKRESGNGKMFFEDISVKSINEVSIHPIDINQDKFSFLRRAIYDFQYLNFEFSENIKVYTLFDDPNRFIIQGQKKAVALSLPEKPLT